MAVLNVRRSGRREQQRGLYRRMTGLAAAMGVLAGVLAASSVPSFAANLTQTINGYVYDTANHAVPGAIVGLKATTSPNPNNPLADADYYYKTDSTGRYVAGVPAGKTYTIAATQIALNGNQVASTTLPVPVTTTTLIATYNSNQPLETAPAAAPLALSSAVTSPAGTPAAAVDNDLSTAWQTDPNQTIDQQYIIVDLGAPTVIAQMHLWWQTLPGAYSVQASSNYDPQAGTGSWTSVYASSSVHGYAPSGTSSVQMEDIVPAVPLTARYLRVRVDAYAAGQTTASLAELAVTAAPPLTGTVTDMNGAPVANATVGYFLDDGPYVTTDANGHYTLPAPMGTLVVGAHKDGMALSGPRWLDSSMGPITADYTLFPAGASLLSGLTPTVVPGYTKGANLQYVNDGDLTTAWQCGFAGTITPSFPVKLTFTLNQATVGQIEVHWKNDPLVWRVEMTNTVTDANGHNPVASTRNYYSADATTPGASGSYLAPGTDDRHVVVIKTPPVTGVTTLSIVVTQSRDANPISMYEVTATAPPQPGLADAAAVARIAGGLQAAPTDPNAIFRWNAANTDTKLNFQDAIQLIRDMGQEVKPLRVLVINYQPYIESGKWDSLNKGGYLLRQVTGWHDPHINTNEHVKDMVLASHGYLRINLLPQIEADEYPPFTNGYQFTDDTYLTAWKSGTWPSGSCDYNSIIQAHDLVRRVDCGDVDEVWLQATPGMQMWETTMAGPNAYWCNSGPVPGTNGTRLFVITAFNYEREPDVMIHDWGHRAESIVGNKVYGGYWYGKTTVNSTWDQYARYDKVFPGQASGGNCHFPPNATADYDYGNTTYVSSDADDWLNYPNLTGARKQVNCYNWQGPRNGNYGAGGPDWQRNFLIWWFYRMPHIPDTGPDGKLANWWKYIVDMNSYPESR